MDNTALESQVFMVRIWNGHAAAFRAVARRVGDDEWTLLDAPSAIEAYFRRGGAAVVPAATTCLEIHTLGRFELLRDGVPPPAGGKAQKKVLDLLKALIAFGGRAVGERRLCDSLWPDAEADAARQSLKATLHRLRRLIGHAAVTVREGKLALAADVCKVDAWEFEAQVDHALGLPVATPAHELATVVEGALRAYQGAFLEGEDLSFALAMRERLRTKLLRAIAQAANALQAAGACERGMLLLERGLDLDPLAEPIYQALMRAQLACGRRTQAMLTFERCRRTLFAAFAIAPSVETLALRRQAAPVAA